MGNSKTKYENREISRLKAKLQELASENALLSSKAKSDAVVIASLNKENRTIMHEYEELERKYSESIEELLEIKMAYENSLAELKKMKSHFCKNATQLISELSSLYRRKG